MIGNAHLDPAWMWRMGEGLEAFLATCRSALDRMDETPEFIFTCSSAAHLEFVEQTDPELFARIQQRAAEGRWVNVGGWWVEADCNAPSGESFIRQALLAQRYLLEKFGRPATVGYCVDSFGHNANLPMLLAGAGLRHYVFMRPDVEEKSLPATLFEWVAPSGKSIVAYRIPLHYSNFSRSVEQKLNDLADHPLFTAEHSWMLFYGVGNHGGGPTREQIAQIELAQKKDLSIVFSDPEQFFAEVPRELVAIRDEMQPHAIGCYAAHSELKGLNRRSENALIVAEKLAVLANELTGHAYPAYELRQAWKNVCFNQFHDILGGVAIPEALDDAVSMYRESLSIAERVTRVALQRVASTIDTSEEGESLIVFNPKGFLTEELVPIELWHPHASERGEVLEHLTVLDPKGKECPVQKSLPSGKIGHDRVRFVAKVKVPAFGWRVFRVIRGQRSTAGELIEFEKGKQRSVLIELPRPSTAEALRRSVQTQDFVHIAKVTSYSSAKVDPTNAFVYREAEVYEDESDTWGHEITGYHKLIGKFSVQEVTEIEKGSIYRVTRVVSTYHRSTLIEEYRRYYKGNAIDVHVTLDWREQHAALKLRFDHFCASPHVQYEIPYASIERPTSPNEVPGQSWVHVTGTRNGEPFGMAVITDSKYSYSVTDTSVYVTVARSPLAAHHVPPHAVTPQERKQYLDQGVQEFNIRLLQHVPDWRAAELHRHSAELHRPCIAHIESAHPGKHVSSYSLLSVDNPAVEIATVKRSESGEDLIVRLVERTGMEQECRLTSKKLGVDELLSLRPFDIVTLRVTSSGAVTHTSSIEEDL